MSDELTREEHLRAKTRDDDSIFIAYSLGHDKAVKMFNAKNCETCIKKPKEGDNYSFECGECCHFYGSSWEEK